MPRPSPTSLASCARSRGERLRLVRYERPFNFSAKVNAGAVRSDGEHLLLLNDDIEVATPDWIERMVMYSQIPEVGAVGGRLLWEDGRLQHVGVAFENTAFRATPIGASPETSRATRNSVRVAQNASR